MDQVRVKIFADKDMPRLRYIAGFILGDMMGLDWEIITDKRKLGKNPVINYSCESVKGSFIIKPEDILFETGVRKPDLKPGEWNGIPVLFMSREGGDLPFDIFAASFYLVSRYEEYLPFTGDEHGRFTARNSAAFKYGFLLKPVVDLWIREFKKHLVVRFQNLVFRKNKYRSLVTVDIDEPFEYLGKDVLRNIGNLLKELGSKSGKAGERYRTVTKGEKDPWDVFDYITETVAETGSEARFFIPVGERSKFDHQPSWNNEEYRKLIRRISSAFDTGLHPSYYASSDNEKLATEKERLEKLIGSRINTSRFHYLMNSFPDSYMNLLANGITEDYSLGYADEPGFRAGTAQPFFFYNLITDKQTRLKIIPFQVMDVTLYRYKGYTPEAAAEIVSTLIEETRNAGGLFMTIWHNTSLLDTGEWHGWRGVFESMLKMQKS